MTNKKLKERRAEGAGLPDLGHDPAEGPVAAAQALPPGAVSPGDQRVRFFREVEANDLRIILDNSAIRRIYCNGRTSWQYYEKLIRPVIGLEAVCLPSTSPANAQWTLERLIVAWSLIFT